MVFKKKENIMLYDYKNRLSATLFVNTLSSDCILKSLKRKEFLSNLDDLDILMLSKYFFKALKREGLDNTLYIDFKSIREKEAQYTKESFEYIAEIEFSGKCKFMKESEFIKHINNNKFTLVYYENLAGLKDYLGV